MSIDINKLSIEEKVGQMLFVGMNTNYITDRERDLIKKYKIGGIILYRKNFKTYEDLLKLIKELKNLNKENKIPLFIGIDQEGGRVNRMPKEILNLPSAFKLAKSKKIEIVEESAHITGEILRKTGFNINFSPVLDIKRFDNNHAIGDRCFGENIEDVKKYGITTMKQLQKEKIISVIKHFPGHGSTTQDSHYMLPIINKKIQDLEKEDMLVFKEAISNGADAILVGHLIIKNLTGIYPASLSKKFIAKYLRMKYKYKGLIVTDDLKMKAVKFFYGTTYSVKKAFEAGNDIIVFRFNKKEEKHAINTIINLVRKNKIKQNRINASVKRIIKIKNKYNISDYEEIPGINIDEINQQIKNIIEQIC